MSLSKIYKSFQMVETENKVINNTYEAPPAIIEETTDEADEQVISAAEVEAEKIISEAREEAKRILSAEQEKIENWWNEKRNEDARIKDESKASGYEEGYQLGLVQAEEKLKEQYEDMFNQAQSILKEAFRLKEQIIEESEEELIELSITIAEKIIRRELESNQDIVKNMVKEILRRTKEYEKISIFVPPDYHTYMQGAREELLAELSGQVELMIFPDPSILENGCIIKTSYGTLDAKIDTQLEEIKNHLFEIAGGDINESKN